MKIYQLHIIIFLLLITLICSATNEIKYYGPKEERLTGVVRFLTFPGRPNYTSIEEGDEAEKQPYLFLDKVIDLKMSLPKDNVINVYDDQTNIRLVQLIMPLKDYKLIKEGQKITVKGELLGAISGHHHAKILIDVNELAIEKNQHIESIVNFKKLITHSLRPTSDDIVQQFY